MRTSKENQRLLSPIIDRIKDDLEDADEIINLVLDLHTIRAYQTEIVDSEDWIYEFDDIEYDPEDLSSPNLARTKDQHLEQAYAIEQRVVDEIVEKVNLSELFESQNMTEGHEDAIGRMRARYFPVPSDSKVPVN